eukprot:CAMPEP_0171157810 /NCGR_PEP_ID=MMETSP0790-20130122/2162_1 /TAXON_ID=2925 /ORGANISM="Alexandrium catenella, Strain OF101" /LENGTH=395 /DNA_ID=CAMNT_0011622181 /DNA_START=19 /DNA_END=1203 /DNA_ORIENTATION=+
MASAALPLSLVSFCFMAGYFHFVLRSCVRRSRGAGQLDVVSGKLHGAAGGNGAGSRASIRRGLGAGHAAEDLHGGMVAHAAGVHMGREGDAAVYALGCAHLTMALLAVPLYTLAPSLGIRAMPATTDMLFMVGMLMLQAVTLSLLMVRPRRSSQGVLARCPRLMFILALFLVSSMVTTITNLKGLLIRLNYPPAVVVTACCLSYKGCGLVARLIFRHLSIPVFVCFITVFAFDASVMVALRRYWLSLPDLADVVAAAAATAVMELGCSLASAAFAVRSYNAFVRSARVETACAHISLFSMSIVSDILAEHVALHGCLGQDLFLDARVLTIAVHADKSKAMAAWGISFLIEICVDVLIMSLMILFLPISFRTLFGKHVSRRSAVLYMLVSAIQPHL